MDRISSFFLARCIISVASLSFLSMRLSYKREHLSIPDFNDRSRKKYSCVLDMTISDSDRLLMAESSIWWFVLSDV